METEQIPQIETQSFDYAVRLEGEIESLDGTSGKSTKEFDTLDEPIKETILRDLRAVGVKFYHVLQPKQKTSLLKDWDLWGPLFLCIFLSIMLQGTSPSHSNEVEGLQFAEVFVIVWLGAIVVTLNSKLLGGDLSFFQSVCVLGYCLLAPCIALMFCKLLLFFLGHSTLSFILRFLVTMLGFAWATFASVSFLGESQPANRKALAMYPIFLFYFVISWLVISHSPE